MQGFQLTLFTQQDRRHSPAPMVEWLLLEARKLGLSGGAFVGAGEGFGHDDKLHSVHFLALADQPLEVTFSASAADTDRFFNDCAKKKSTPSISKRRLRLA